MHDNMPKLVREAEALPISRHVAVQEDARWHVRDLNREAIHLERGEITMHDDAACAFDQCEKFPDWPRRYKPGAPDEIRDTFGVATILVDIQTRKGQLRLQLGRVEQSSNMQNPDVEFSFQALDRLLSNARPLPVLHAHRQADDPVILEEEIDRKTQGFADALQHVFSRADQPVLKFREVCL